MKFVKIFCCFTLMIFAMGAMSQTAESKPAASQTPAPAPTISSMVDKQISGIEKQFVEAAEAMPEGKFNFTPESLNIPGSDYKTVRTFALEVKHVATANYFYWCSVTGDKMPQGIKGPNGPDELQTKAEIIKYLKDSFAIGHKAAATLTSENIMEPLPFRTSKLPRLNLVSAPVPHAFDHYGQMVEYLRMNGVVPPASRAN